MVTLKQSGHKQERAEGTLVVRLVTLVEVREDARREVDYL